ncbi:hypothetical protein EfmAA242_16030 [Enterococcus faecium]|nr:hypothetical protein EfmAA242_16030 [Enterococcus faecium]
MMSKNNTNGRNQFAMLTIDDLVPQDHLVRKIDAARLKTIRMVEINLRCLRLMI